MSIKFLAFGGGGYFGFLGGGGSANFIFMGARIFLTKFVCKPFGVMDVRVFGSLMSARKCLLVQPKGPCDTKNTTSRGFF